MRNLLLLHVPFNRYAFSFCPGRRQVGDFFDIFLVFVLLITPRWNIRTAQELDGKDDPGGLFKLFELLSLTSSPKIRKNHKTFFFGPSTPFYYFSQQNHQSRGKNVAGRLSGVSVLALEKVNKKRESLGIEPTVYGNFNNGELNIKC